ncbi:hypothetical protein [Kibdelosporangium philippinense]|uniref:hypothetical protein n=1 Tax=Kibdelosporangium philippinense TaxID=211113 RepID=UPI00360D4D70
MSIDTCRDDVTALRYGNWITLRLFVAGRSLAPTADRGSAADRRADCVRRVVELAHWAHGARAPLTGDGGLVFPAGG